MGNLIEIARFYDPEEAYCAKSFLLSNGIDSFVQNDHYLTMAPWMRIALHGYGLQVMASSEDNARTLLRYIGATPLEIVEEDFVEDIPRKQKTNWLWLPVAFSTGVPFLPKPRAGWFGALQGAALLTLYMLVLYVLFEWLWWFRYQM